MKKKQKLQIDAKKASIKILLFALLLASLCLATKFLILPSLRGEDGIVVPITVNDFETCTASGRPAMESYPRKCSYGGKLYTENIGNVLEKQDLIRLENVQPNQEVSSPLIITGEARGYWFFEATFPVILTDWDGKIIAEGFATAQDGWMTEDFVPFSAALDFETPNLYNRGSLILKKANASGMPQNDDALEIPIRFRK